MKRLYLFSWIFISFILAACSTVTHKPQPVMKVENAAPKQCPLKNPINVAFYNKGKAPLHPYKIIAKESISQFNAGGIKRQEAVIHDVLRELAASVGGDAIINVTREHDKISGEIVKFTV